jgi:phosphoenolpyruvate---glycerone phosphotransferase subunit DhaK
MHRAGRRPAHVRRGRLERADAVADQLVDAILADLPHQRDDRVDVLVNGLGATPVEELYILYRRAAARLGEAGLEVRRAWIGEYATSLEMAGASISVLKVDAELTRLVDAPAASPFLVRR